MGIDEDMAVEFYLTCSNSLLMVRFATKPELACKKETKAVSIQNQAQVLLVLLLPTLLQGM